jgi:hypothetical protein
MDRASISKITIQKLYTSDKELPILKISEHCWLGFSASPGSRMRPVYVCALFIACLPAAKASSSMDIPSGIANPDVTVVLDIKGTLPAGSLHEMEKETQDIIGRSGIRLGWSSKAEAMNGTFNDLVVMTFKGTCTLDPAPPLYDELGPYAFTRVSNGQVQPFGEVDCDRVSQSVRGAMGGDDYSRTDLLMGRALGRVVAHELVHMLTKSGKHAHDGVEKPALSGRQLISNSLPLSAMDIDRLKQERLNGHRF